MKKLRLCYVGPADNVTTRRWVEWYAARGHETTVLTVEPVDRVVPISFEQVDLRSGGPARKIGRLISAARLTLQLKRRCPDVVHAHYVRGLAWGLLLARRHPFVATPWGSDVLEEQGAFLEWYAKPLTRSLLRSADVITTHSCYMESRVRSLLGTAGSLVRIGWGVDLHRFRTGLDVTALRQRWKIDQDRRVILSPRLTQPFYHHELVIEALPAVCRKVPRVLLVIPVHRADPVYASDLRRLTAELKMTEHVLFVDSIPYLEMPRWMNLADMLVMLPDSDGMPNTLLEAMACGTIPLLKRLPQYLELVKHGENGYLVESAENDLPQNIVKGLTDMAERTQMAKRNHAIIKEVGDQDREMRKMEEWYERLAGEFPSR